MKRSRLSITSTLVLLFLFTYILPGAVQAQQGNQPNRNFQMADGGNLASDIMSANDLAAPKKARDELHRGLSDCQNSRWEESVTHFQKAIVQYPKYDSAYYNLGIAYLHANQIEKARDVLSTALKFNPGNHLVMLGMGLLLTQESRYSEAEVYLKESLNRDPRNLGTLAILSFVQLKLEKFEEALATAQKVHRPGHQAFCFSHLIAAAALLSLHRDNEAAVEFRFYVDEEPNGPQADVARNFLESRAAIAARNAN